MPEAIHPYSIACPTDEVAATCHSSISTANITTATTSKSFTKTSDVPLARPDFKDQPPIIRIVLTDQAADDTNEQNHGHTTATSQDSATPNQMKQPAKNSSHASDIDTRVDSKGSQVRRKGKLLTEKCKKIWRKASDLVLDVRYRGHTNNGIGANIDCNDSQDHPDSDSSTDDDFNDSDSSTNDDVNDNEEHPHNDNDADDDDGDQHPRCDFKAIKAINNEQLEALARCICDTGHAIPEVCVVHRTQGAYNFAATIAVSRGEEVSRYVVRIPGHATLAHWTPEDAYMLEREAQLIEHIRKNTSVPVAEIVHYSTDHTNMLGFPYFFMTELPGKPASNIWYDGDYEHDDFELAFQHADVPSVATEKKRITFLRSLARVMTELQSLTFDMAGMPMLSEREGTMIGPIYHWGNSGSDFVWKYSPCNSTGGYAFAGVGRQFVKLSPSHSASDLMLRGAIKFFNLLFSQSVFKTTRPETFTIHHDDLDLQNIFVDDAGNVTGIIDWDKAFAAPRCIGTAAAPLFLQKDWLPDYVNNLGTGPHMGWKMHSYREIYAAALLEAGNPDAMYTINSAMYRAGFKAVRDMDGCMYDFIDKMLRELPHCRIKAVDFAHALALGWQDAEDMLKVEFAKIVEPQLPRPNLLAQLDAEITMKDWWSTFEDHITEDEDETDCGSISASEAVAKLE
jgi:aminoglycoside phosphotransferase (APT) family kinase protein